jgi:hypothetical protein
MIAKNDKRADAEICLRVKLQLDFLVQAVVLWGGVASFENSMRVGDKRIGGYSDNHSFKAKSNAKVSNSIEKSRLHLI